MLKASICFSIKLHLDPSNCFHCLNLKIYRPRFGLPFLILGRDLVVVILRKTGAKDTPVLKAMTGKK